MNIVQIQSGLGNQLFQYAFALALQEQKRDTLKLDISQYRHRPSHNGYELENIFNINANYATTAERDFAADVDKNLISYIRRKLLGRQQRHANLIEEKDYNFVYSPQLLQLTNSYFIGYWQSEKYFSHIAPQLRQKLTFCQQLAPCNQAIAESITPKSVSIHVRLGDYQKQKLKYNYGSVCNTTYYNNAIKYLQNRYADLMFYVFSDEPHKAQQMLNIDSAVYVDNNNVTNAWQDMFLMSLCQHHIIANSSFSWWGAWLGEKEGGITIAPSVWFNGKQRPDVCPQRWIKISNIQ